MYVVVVSSKDGIYRIRGRDPTKNKEVRVSSHKVLLDLHFVLQSILFVCLFVCLFSKQICEGAGSCVTFLSWELLMLDYTVTAKSWGNQT